MTKIRIAPVGEFPGKTIYTVLLLLTALILTAQTPSFPGAEGDGMFTTGGRGGTVYHVTKLTDDGSEGTLRYAINRNGTRTIVFDMAGIIPLSSELRIRNGNLTIAGQSAPGDGICLKNFPVVVDANNVIIRFMRFRMGDEAAAAALLAGDTSYGWDGADAIWGRNQSDVMIDHCSMSWNIDECSSFYGNTRFTMQWCFMAESMRASVHSKGSHGYGGIWGGSPATFHHNILAFHDSRNPRFCGSRYTNKPENEKINFINNVLYNWGGNSGYAGEGGTYNMMNNYYRSGPGTKSSVSYRIFSPNPDGGTNSQPAGVWGTFHLSGNIMHNSSQTTANNWLGLQPANLGSTNIEDLKSYIPFAMPQIQMETAGDAYQSVTQKAGASLKRDAVDIRIVNNILNGTVSCVAGSNGSTGGMIDSQNDVGGWPEYTSTPEQILADTDRDGMPDAWESSKGLNPAQIDGAAYTLSQVYTNLEVYLNELVIPVMGITASVEIPNASTRKLKVITQPDGYASFQLDLAESTDLALYLYDANGRQTVLQLNSNLLPGKQELTVSGLKKGVFFYKVQSGNVVSASNANLNSGFVSDGSVPMSGRFIQK